MAATTTTSSSALPDELLMEEYDLLQFVENDDVLHGTTATGERLSDASAFQFANMDDFLGNSNILLDSLDHNLDHVGASAAQRSNVGPNGNMAKTAPTKHRPSATDGGGGRGLMQDESTLLDELLDGGDELLVPLASQSAKTASPGAASPSPLDDGCLTDVDAMSPCPSSCSESVHTPPPGHFDELTGMAKIDAHISPAGTPAMAHHHDTTKKTFMMPTSPVLESLIAEEDDEDALHESHLNATAEEADDEIMDAETMEDDASHNVDLLEKEAKYLEAQYDYLVSRAHTARNTRVSVKAKRRAREEQQLVKKSQDNTLLTQLVTQQQSYLENLKAMLAFAPVNDIRMALMTPIESYIHLGKNLEERRQTILNLREDKLDMTYKYIEEKARGISPDQPYQYADVFERFGKWYSVHFAVSKYDDVEVGQVVKVVYDQMAGKDESLAQAMGCLTIRESYDSIKCNFLHQRIVSSLKWSDQFEEGLPELESNSLFLCRFAGDTAVFATDYIDQDDLHPYLSKDRIRKDVTSGVVLTAHVDENGKRSVIMKKFLMAKFHMFPHKVSDKVTDILFSKMPNMGQKRR
ncbi:hypothetical protein P43SY_001480 [Pythium insidiosum]|uniref:Uncharacterized protein n=1 Tax=Pythium insidiosum TaxID=114742 RepID=A0AAD5Q833_PYTIN|nr:hypothetical protein P43SY_001480 [Pythium insidiosum]